MITTNSKRKKIHDKKIPIVEVMAPVGSLEALHAAIKAGADSVYFGVEQLNMRARAANNFNLEDLKNIAAICKDAKVRTYLTVNTILYDHDISLLRKVCEAASTAGISAVIASDIAAIEYARSIGLQVHISTQCNVTNIETVKFYARYADVIVLARELTLSQITHVIEEIKKQDVKGPSGNLVRIEIFAHGALCVAVSGKCYMSLATYNASANRGACLQNCRRSYKIIDEETGDELKIDNKFIMSPKDLSTITFLDKLIDAGVSVLKLEGRGRAPDYVYIVTKCYKEASSAVKDNTYTKDKIKQWQEELATVYNRGFWEGGYYLGKKLGEWSGSYGSQATEEKKYIGKIDNYFGKAGVASLLLETGTLKVGDKILITGPTTGVLYATIKKLLKDKKKMISAAKNDLVSFPLSEKVRKNDKVYVIEKRQENA